MPGALARKSLVLPRDKTGSRLLQWKVVKLTQSLDFAFFFFFRLTDNPWCFKRLFSCGTVRTEISCGELIFGRSESISNKSKNTILNKSTKPDNFRHWRPRSAWIFLTMWMQLIERRLCHKLTGSWISFARCHVELSEFENHNHHMFSSSPQKVNVVFTRVYCVLTNLRSLK